MKIRSIVLILLGTLTILLLTQCSSSKSTNSLPADTNVPSNQNTTLATPTTENPPAASTSLDGAALVQERCTVCHGIERIQAATKTKDEWTSTVNRMIGKGANLNADVKTAVINYLAETYKK
jgi:cytochrome c5